MIKQLLKARHEGLLFPQGCLRRNNPNGSIMGSIVLKLAYLGRPLERVVLIYTNSISPDIGVPENVFLEVAESIIEVGGDAKPLLIDDDFMSPFRTAPNI